MIEINLKRLGYKEAEIQLYITLLQRGTSSVSTLSKHTRIPRANCYKHLMNLAQDGLVLKTLKRGILNFLAANPQIIINKQKELLNIAESSLPTLLKYINPDMIEPEIQVLDGKEGLNKVLKILQSPVAGRLIQSLSSANVLNTIQTDFFEKILQERVKTKSKTNLFMPQTDESMRLSTWLDSQPEIKKYVSLKLLSVDLMNKNPISDITIWSGHVALFEIVGSSLQTIIIKNSTIYNTVKCLFEIAWDQKN